MSVASDSQIERVHTRERERSAASASWREREGRGRSVAATAARHHVIVLLEHHVLVVVKVQQVDGEQLVGHAARRLDAPRQLQGVDDGLHRGVVAGPHVLTQREGAGALAVVGVVATRRHDPARPADLLEVHVEGQALAGRRGPAGVLLAVVQGPGAAGGRGPRHGYVGQQGRVHGICGQGWEPPVRIGT